MARMTNPVAMAAPRPDRRSLLAGFLVAAPGSVSKPWRRCKTALTSLSLGSLLFDGAISANQAAPHGACHSESGREGGSRSIARTPAGLQPMRDDRISLPPYSPLSSQRTWRCCYSSRCAAVSMTIPASKCNRHATGAPLKGMPADRREMRLRRRRSRRLRSTSSRQMHPLSIVAAAAARIVHNARG